MIVQVNVVWSADDMMVLSSPGGVSRAAAAEILSVNPVTIGRWIRAGKVSLLDGSKKICSLSLKSFVEQQVAESIAKAVKFGGKADA